MALLFQVFIFERLMKRMGIVKVSAAAASSSSSRFRKVTMTNDDVIKVYKMGLSMMAITTVVLPLASLIYWWLGKETYSWKEKKTDRSSNFLIRSFDVE